MKNKPNIFVSIIWGYQTYFYNFDLEEHYHMHALKIADEMGYETIAILKAQKDIIENDPHFNKKTKVIYYSNIFQFVAHIIKYSFKGSIFYVNSVEPLSLLIPFLASKTIFMGHTHPKRQTYFKQKIFNFSMKAFSRIRLNNQNEKKFLLSEGIPEEKLRIVPLSISLKKYRILDPHSARNDLVYFGNITAKKNLVTIVKACNIVAEKYLGIKLHLVGKEYDKIDPTLISNDLELIRHGFIKETGDVNILLNKFLIYLNSSFDEGMCVSVYNAALSGCALCLPNIMSFSDIFENKALFHEVLDHRKLAENIIQYLEHPEIIKEYSKRCQDIIPKNFNYTKISGDMKELFIF